MTNSAQTIRLAHKIFEGPFPINGWTPPPRAGVFCIMVPDSRCVPPYRPVYFGQSQNLAERVFPRAHHGHARWLDIADYALAIYVAAHWMPQSTLDERKATERQLVQLCQPE